MPASPAHRVSTGERLNSAETTGKLQQAAAARGIRWNDPAFAIEWPVTNPILHPRDATYPDFQGNGH